jgi:hypothetical protein
MSRVASCALPDSSARAAALSSVASVASEFASGRARRGRPCSRGVAPSASGWGCPAWLPRPRACRTTSPHRRRCRTTTICGQRVVEALEPFLGVRDTWSPSAAAEEDPVQGRPEPLHVRVDVIAGEQLQTGREVGDVAADAATEQVVHVGHRLQRLGGLVHTGRGRVKLEFAILSSTMDRTRPCCRYRGGALAQNVPTSFPAFCARGAHRFEGRC